MPRFTSLTRKGQVTIPKEVRERLGLDPFDKVEVWVENGEARLRKARRLTLRDVAGSIPAPDLPFDEAIARAKEEVIAEKAGRTRDILTRQQ